MKHYETYGKYTKRTFVTDIYIILLVIGCMLYAIGALLLLAGMIYGICLFIISLLPK